MKDFWLSCGHHLLDRHDGGGLAITDEFLKLYLARPELAPPPDACVVERTLHAALLADPRRPVMAAEVAAVADADARENYELLLAWRDHLMTYPTIEAMAAPALIILVTDIIVTIRVSSRLPGQYLRPRGGG